MQVSNLTSTNEQNFLLQRFCIYQEGTFEFDEIQNSRSQAEQTGKLLYRILYFHVKKYSNVRFRY